MKNMPVLKAHLQDEFDKIGKEEKARLARRAKTEEMLNRKKRLREEQEAAAGEASTANADPSDSVEEPPAKRQHSEVPETNRAEETKVVEEHE